MLTKNEIKYIQSLFHKKQRDEEKLFVAEGPKLAGELLDSQKSSVIHIYATSKWLKNNLLLTASATEISDIELGKISNLQTPNEVVVIARQFSPTDEPIFKGRLTIILDGIQDPGNMGTIVRIADWFGIEHLICSHDCVDIYSPKVVQATMGSVVRVNYWYKDLSEWSPRIEIPVFGALLNGKNIYSIGKVEEGLLVIGNESKGIRQPFISKITHPVTIPKWGNAESLNAAVATGIIVGCMVNNV